jgi:hypothetical protein
LLRTKTNPPLPARLGAKFNTVDGECYVRLKECKDGWDIYKEFPSGVQSYDSIS